jgi:tetratricopeptide (TPR) repeat protein
MFCSFSTIANTNQDNLIDHDKTLQLVSDGALGKSVDVKALESQFLKIEDKDKRYRLALILSHFTQELKEADPIYVLRNALKALTDKKEKFRLLRLLADWYFQKGKLDQAKETFEKNLKLNPKNIENAYLLYKLGWVYINKERPYKALALWQKSIEEYKNSTLLPVMIKDYGKILAENMHGQLSPNFKLAAGISQNTELYQGIRAGLTRSSWTPTKKLVGNFQRLKILPNFIQQTLADKAFYLPNPCDVSKWFAPITKIQLTKERLQYLNTPMRKCGDKKSANNNMMQTKVLDKVQVDKDSLFLLARIQYQMRSKKFCSTLLDSVFVNKDKKQITNAIQTLSKKCPKTGLKGSMNKFVYRVPVKFKAKLPYLLSKQNRTQFSSRFFDYNLSQKHQNQVIDFLTSEHPTLSLKILREKSKIKEDIEFWQRHYAANEKLLSQTEKLEIMNLTLSGTGSNKTAMQKSLLYMVKHDMAYLKDNWEKHKSTIESQKILKEEYFISGLGDDSLQSKTLLRIKKKLLAGELRKEHKSFSKPTQRQLNRYSGMIRNLQKEIKFLKNCGCLKKLSNKQWLTNKYYRIKKMKKRIDRHTYLHQGLATNVQKQFNIIIDEYLGLFEQKRSDQNPLLANFELVFKKWRYTL